MAGILNKLGCCRPATEVVMKLDLHPEFVLHIIDFPTPLMYGAAHRYSKTQNWNVPCMT